MKNNKIKIAIILITTITIAIFYYIFFFNMPNLSPQITSYTVINPKTGKEIYFKHETRGLSFNVMLLSNDKNSSYNENMDYIFEYNELFYKLDNDTLKIITGAEYKKPKFFKTDFIIITDTIFTNPDYNNFKIRYKSKGYTKIP
jgi:hypothetical protein